MIHGIPFGQTIMSSIADLIAVCIRFPICKYDIAITWRIAGFEAGMWYIAVVSDQRL